MKKILLTLFVILNSVDANSKLVGTISPWRGNFETSTNCIDKVYFNVINNYNYQSCRKTLDYFENNKDADFDTHSDVYDKYIKNLKLIDNSWFSDYVCFIDPMDKHPRNMVRVLSSIGYIYEYHTDANLKNNISDANKIKIIDKLRFKEWRSLENYKLESGKFFVIDKFSDGNDEKLGIYYRNKNVGELYKCTKISIYKTKSNELNIKPYDVFKYIKQKNKVIDL